jgi:hypothetical protein
MPYRLNCPGKTNQRLEQPHNIDQECLIRLSRSGKMANALGSRTTLGMLAGNAQNGIFQGNILSGAQD